MDETNIGAVILSLRKQRGMTQEQLAEAVGVSPPAVSKWETCSNCPDVALLAPIARALDTDVNTLLSFTPTLSQVELLAAVKEVGKLAEQDGPAAMGFPQLYGWPDETKEAAWDFAEQGLEYVRQHGEKKLWPTATFMLAGLLLNRDKLAQAEALADSLPVMPLSPQTLYAALYQKQKQPEKAWEQARMQLMNGSQAVLQALSLLAASDAPDASRALAAYGAVAKALGYPPCLLNIQLAAHAMESGEEALEKLQTVVRELKGETEQFHPLWGATPQPGDSYYRTLARMLQNDLRTDSKFQALQNIPTFTKILHQLDPEA